MRDYLLDTQTIRYWYDSRCPQHAAVIGNIDTLSRLSQPLAVKPKLLVSVVTVGEIEFGHHDASDPDADAQAAYVRFIQEELPSPLEVSVDASVIYGELRSRLFNRFAPKQDRKKGMLPEELVELITAKKLGIQENDLWICAQAAAHRMVLVTNDRMAHIREAAAGLVPELLVQNWTFEGSASLAS